MKKSKKQPDFKPGCFYISKVSFNWFLTKSAKLNNTAPHNPAVLSIQQRT